MTQRTRTRVLFLYVYTHACLLLCVVLTQLPGNQYTLSGTLYIHVEKVDKVLKCNNAWSFFVN